MHAQRTTRGGRGTAGADRLKKEHEAKVASLEMQIAAQESRQKEIAAELENPAIYDAGGVVMNLNRELMSVTEALERLIAQNVEV